jgi:hypothetical protein
VYLCLVAVTSPLAAKAEAAETNSSTSALVKGMLVRGHVIDGKASSSYAASNSKVPVFFMRNVFWFVIVFLSCK